MFIRGKFNGNFIDNTTTEEINAWLKMLKEINPKYVMLYPIERDTPTEKLIKIPEEELNLIAAKAENMGIKTKVYG